VSASVAGSSHDRSGTPCQDSSACALLEHAQGPHLVAVACDGAGSARLSHLGARLACALAVDHARAFLAPGRTLEHFERAHAEELVAALALRLRRTARQADVRPHELACTFLFALLGPEAAVFVQLGDGAIVAAAADAPPQTYRCVFWPQRGEYANETRFVSEADALDGLCFAREIGCVRELALFTDGLQALVLDERTRAAHARFFAPMFAALPSTRPGPDAPHARDLAAWLGSPRVRARTDDDTTLVLARRVQPEPAAALPVPPRPRVERPV